MQQFHKEFINTCLEQLKSILSSPTQLNTAVAGFNNGDNQNERYHLQSISDASSWTATEIKLFSGAVSESVAIATSHSQQDGDKLIEIAEATVLFKSTVIPKITSNIEKNSALNTIIANINQYLKEQTAEQTPSFICTSLGFFSTVAALSTATIVSLTMIRK